MSNIKKAFQPIIALLTANASARVSDVMDEVVAMCSAKVGGGTTTRSFYKIGDLLVAARCGFFEKWFDPEVQEFGKKAGTASGLNSMSKIGVNEWTARNNAHKKAREEAFADFTAGTIDSEAFKQRLVDIDAARDADRVLPEGVVGYDTLEELLAARGLTLGDSEA